MDLPTPDPAAQPCIGPEGHIPPTIFTRNGAAAVVPRYRASIPGFPEITLLVEAAAVGNPCVGTVSQVYDDDGTLITGPHARTILARFDPPIPSAPGAVLAAGRDDAGQIQEWLLDIPGPNRLPLASATRLLDAWRAALNFSVRLGGRPAWSGKYFFSADDFVEAAVGGLAHLYHVRLSPTQNNLLGWLADNRDEDFRNLSTSRISEWCKQSNVLWKELQQRGFQSSRGFPGGFLDSQTPLDEEP